MFAKIKSFLKTIKLHWWMVYGAYGILVYIHLFKIWGLVGMTIALVLLNTQIHKLD
jgi:hypothetical protein